MKLSFSSALRYTVMFHQEFVFRTHSFCILPWSEEPSFTPI